MMLSVVMRARVRTVWMTKMVLTLNMKGTLMKLTGVDATYLNL
jgi:hypothetical protein